MDLRRRRTVTVRLRGRPLMYPGVYVSAAVLTLQAMVGGSLRGARGHGVRLVLAGMVVQALAFIFWSERLLDNTYMPGASFVDPLWGVSLLPIGAGGVMSSREEEGARHRRGAGDPRRRAAGRHVRAARRRPGPRRDQRAAVRGPRRPDRRPADV